MTTRAHERRAAERYMLDEAEELDAITREQRERAVKGLPGGPRTWHHFYRVDLAVVTAVPVMAGDVVRVLDGPMMDEPVAVYVVERITEDGVPVLGRNLLAPCDLLAEAWERREAEIERFYTPEGLDRVMDGLTGKAV